MRNILSLCVLVFCVSSGFAVQLKTVSNNATVNAHVSATNKTRIYVAGERISALRGTPGAYTFVNDDVNGQVFITPTPSYRNKPFSIFITTNTHATYGLTLTPTERLSASIELKPTGAMNLKAAKRFETSSPYAQTVIELIRYMVNGMTPKGYAVSTPSNAKSGWLGNIATVTLKTVYQGAHLIGKVYVLKNQLNKPIRLDEAELYRAGTRAIALENTVIDAKGQTLVYEVDGHE